MEHHGIPWHFVHLCAQSCWALFGNPLVSDCSHPAGHCEAVRVLIEAAADVNRRTLAGSSPLYQACRDGTRHIAQLLLTAKASIHNTWDTSPFIAACVEGHLDLVKLLLRHCDQGHDGQLGALAPAVATLEDPQLVEQVLRMMRKRREADDEELVTRATTRLKCSFRRTGWRPTEGWNGFKVDSKVDPNRLKRRVRLCWKESVLLCWSEGVGAVLYVGVCRWSSTSDTRNVLKLRVLLQRRQLHETQMIKLPKAHNVKLSAMKSDSGWPMACRASWTLNGIWSGWRMSAWRKGSRSFKLHIVKWSWTVEDVVLPWRYIPHFTTAVSSDSMTLNCWHYICWVLVWLHLVEERGGKRDRRGSTEAKPHFTSSMWMVRCQETWRL